MTKPTIQVLFFHMAPSNAARFVEVLKRTGLPVKPYNFTVQGFSSVYDGRTGIVSRFPSFQSFLGHHGIEQTALVGSENEIVTNPIVLIGFSAGCFALRDWCNSERYGEENRKLITALVFSDGLHGGLRDGECMALSLRGVIAYAIERCAIDKGYLIDAYSQIDTTGEGYASTSLCAKKLREETVGIPNIVFKSSPGGDAKAHAYSVQAATPEAVNQALVPWLAGKFGEKATIGPQPPAPNKPSEPPVTVTPTNGNGSLPGGDKPTGIVKPKSQNNAIAWVLGGFAAFFAFLGLTRRR